MTERVEEIRLRHADDLSMLAKNPRLTDEGDAGWQDIADVRDLLTALAQADRERDEMEADYEKEIAARRTMLAEARAEVERLKADYAKKELDAYSDRAEKAEADLARVRAEVERLKEVERWHQGFCTQSCLPGQHASGCYERMINQAKADIAWRQAELERRASTLLKTQATLARVRAAAEDHIQWLRFQHESYERVETVITLRAALEGR